MVQRSFPLLLVLTILAADLFGQDLQAVMPQFPLCVTLRPLRLCGEKFLRANLPQRRRGRGGYAEKIFKLGHYQTALSLDSPDIL
jgi:hypothetical protein